jgi:death on curing protein
MTEYLDLADYLVIAGAVLGQEPENVALFADLPLAESAVAAPAAEFARVEFYPTLSAKAAALVWHIVKNHALPDGNKRVGFLAMVEFIERNGATFRLPDRGDDEVVEMIEGVAAGAVPVEKLTEWLEGLIK